MQYEDTRDLLNFGIELWEDGARRLAREHGAEVFRLCMKAVRARFRVTIGPTWNYAIGSGMPPAGNARALPFFFAVALAEEMALAQYAIFEEWFKKRGIGCWVGSRDNRIAAAQHAGHDEGVHGAARWERMPMMMKIGIGAAIMPLAFHALGLLGRKAA